MPAPPETRERRIARLNGALRSGFCDSRANRSINSAIACGSDAAIFRDLAKNSYLWFPLACGKKFCEPCMIAWSDELQNRILPIAMRLPPAHLRHMVLTIKSPAHGALRAGILVIYRAFRLWRERERRRRGAPWQSCPGYAWKLELDRKKSRAWHPHLHLIVHAPRGFDFTRESHARKSWCDAVEKCGGHAIAAAQWITRPHDGAHAAREILKYAAKPLQLRHLPDRDLAEFATATFGLRFFHASGSLACAPPERESDRNLVFLGNRSTLIRKSRDGDRDAAAILDELDAQSDACAARNAES